MMHSELLCRALHTVFGKALESQVLIPLFLQSHTVLADSKVERTGQTETVGTARLLDTVWTTRFFSSNQTSSLDRFPVVGLCVWQKLPKFMMIQTMIPEKSYETHKS